MDHSILRLRTVAAHCCFSDWHALTHNGSYKYYVHQEFNTKYRYRHTRHLFCGDAQASGWTILWEQTTTTGFVIQAANTTVCDLIVNAYIV